jgi:hypothetical protein
MRIPAISESAKELRLLAWLLASNGCDARKMSRRDAGAPRKMLIVASIFGFSHLFFDCFISSRKLL